MDFQPSDDELSESFFDVEEGDEEVDIEDEE